MRLHSEICCHCLSTKGVVPCSGTATKVCKDPVCGKCREAHRGVCPACYEPVGSVCYLPDVNPAEAFSVGQSVTNLINFAHPASIPAGSVGRITQVYPREASVMFKGNTMVRLEYESIRPC
jgi:hypothetical protein